MHNHFYRFLYIGIFIIFGFIKAQDNFILYDKIMIDASGEKITEKNILYFNKTNSVFINNNYKGTMKEFETFMDNDSSVNTYNVITQYFPDNNFLVSSRSFTREPICSIDTFNDFKWKIQSNEQKEILGYKCQKAVGEFRGRKYTAWFTDAIAVNSGPYKFKGLPGLILEVSDNYNLFTYEAKALFLNKQIKNNYLARIYTPDKKTCVDYKTFIGKENDFIKELRARADANRPTGVVVDTSVRSKDRDFKLEKSFEWETKTP